jgi:hypothetical protein
MFKYILSLFKKKIYTLDGVDLNQETKLYFQKSEYGEYIVCFWNPIFNKWWALPKGYAGITEKWTLLSQGDYGAYDLHMMKCRYNEIDSCKRRFKTLQHIKTYLYEFEKSFDDFNKRRLERSKLPNQIYK